MKSARGMRGSAGADGGRICDDDSSNAGDGDDRGSGQGTEDNNCL